MLKHCLAIGLLLFAALPSATFANDRLNQPALLQKQAQDSVLLSIAKAGKSLVAVGEQGTIVISNDNALSWRQAPVPVSTLLTRVAFANETHGWVVGHDGVVLATNDAGQSWVKQLDGNGINDLLVQAMQLEYQRVESLLELSDEALEQQALNRDELEESYENLEYAIEDAEIAKEEGATIPLLDIAIVNKQELYVAGAYGLLLKSMDAGKSWQFIGHQVPNPEKFHINRFLIASNGHYYLVGESGLLIESRDQGQSWQEMESPYSGSWYNAIYAEQLYVMGLRGHVYQLQEQQWQAIKLGRTATVNDALTYNKGMVLIGNAGLVLKVEGDKVEPIKADNGSYSQGLINNDTLILVGENGVNRVSLVVEQK